ncbi:VanZ family protein [Bacillus sp. UMB0899]|uniref:VanZ family protein n=1 Tax=Metabacillus schmidteae TaxID=2730405 RepID=UPI000C80CAEA|nr:VanZ family protein [Metabacillus schmidteae]PMC33769.1 VanZ family protein [Bacillus sp. UMB0899]
MENSMIFTIDSWYILVPFFIVILLLLIFRTFFRAKHSLWQFLLLTTFFVYFLCMIHLVFFPIEVNIGEYANLTPWYISINYIPILTIDLKTFLLNIIMMVPFGMYLPLLNQKVHSIKKAAFHGLLISLSFEIIQIVLKAALGNGRSTDINDLIANTLGAAVGFLLLKKLTKIDVLSGVVHKLNLDKET